ncbi:MAG: disulfide bond formation protein B [Gammaproteobacteria bacterium]
MRVMFRGYYVIGLIVCLFLLSAAFFFQFVLGLEPCPLCVLTRLVVIGLAGVYLIAILHNPRNFIQKFYSLLTILLTISGLVISARHVWIQHLPPDQVPACGPSFDYLVQTMPFTEAMEIILNGSGECAKVDWTFLGGSIPAWMLVVFSGLIVLNIWAMLKNNKG